MTGPDAPFARIAERLRARILAGELRPGDRVPSTRELVREWGVAMATATKALTVLRQEGLLSALPGIGTVVAAPAAVPAMPAAAGWARGPGEPGLPERERIVALAIGLADTDGIAALSMRRVAAAAGLATMTLYRHVAGKEELRLLMTDAAFAESPLPPAHGPWRARLEASARVQWTVYRRHPWAAEIMSFTRPPMAPHAMAHTEWTLAALSSAGLALPLALQASIMLANHVRGTAVNLEWEANAQQDTGLDNEQWFAAQDRRFEQIVAAGRFPMFVRLATTGEGDIDYGLDAMFEFGLARLLDGLAQLIHSR